MVKNYVPTSITRVLHLRLLRSRFHSKLCEVTGGSPSSGDSTPLDFFLCGVKDTVYNSI